MELFYASSSYFWGDEPPKMNDGGGGGDDEADETVANKTVANKTVANKAVAETKTVAETNKTNAKSITYYSSMLLFGVPIACLMKGSLCGAILSASLAITSVIHHERKRYLQTRNDGLAFMDRIFVRLFAIYSLIYFFSLRTLALTIYTAAVYFVLIPLMKRSELTSGLCEYVHSTMHLLLTYTAFSMVVM